MGRLEKLKEKPKEKQKIKGKFEDKTRGKQRSKRKIEEYPDAAALSVASRRRPKRAAACVDFKEKSLRLFDKGSVIETKRDLVVKDEVAAISLTSGHDVPRPNRRLLDFIFHDEYGKAQPIEMLEVTETYITGLILPLEPSSGNKGKEMGVRCASFGRIEAWSISGYEDGSPVVWASTEIADYECVRPAGTYRKIYELFYEKARACVEVYKKLSRASGGDPDIGVEDLVARVVRSMSDSKNFPKGLSIKEFIFSQGEFIYKQLIGLDDTSKKNEQKFSEMAVLRALCHESKKYSSFGLASGAHRDKEVSTTLKVRDVETENGSTPTVPGEVDEDVKLARLLQEEEDWRSMKQSKSNRRSNSSNKFYIKIHENEIANDYPLPAFYESSCEETDEFILFDDYMDISDANQLPRSMLHNWSLYNSDSRLISLEMLPMKPCADVDVTIFGSGVVTEDDGGGFCLDDSEQASSSSAGMTATGGIPAYLSAIKEWMIEVGASTIFISIRTDMAWYRLGKPSKQYAPWYMTVIKTARLGISIIMLLKEQSRVARMSFADIIKKVSEFDMNHPAFISSNPAAVERYVVVHGQIILQQFAEYPDRAIQTSPFLTGLKENMMRKHHTKWLVKRKAVIQKEANLNPRASMVPVTSKRKLIPATTTRLINRIWGEYYSNYSPENSKEGALDEQKEEMEAEDEEEEYNDDDLEEDVETKSLVQKNEKSPSVIKQKSLCCSNENIEWAGEPSGEMIGSEALYRKAYVHGMLIAVGDSVLVKPLDYDELPSMYFVEYMFEKLDGRKMVHGRLLVRGSQTILGNAANERELFLTNDCLEFELGAVRQCVVVEIRLRPWGYQHRKVNADADRIDRERAKERKKNGLPLEHYCKSLYSPERGAFLRVPKESMGIGNGCCYSCKMKEAKEEKESFKLISQGFKYKGVDYNIKDFVYITPHHLEGEEREKSTFKSGRNVGLKPYAVCQLLEIVSSGASRKVNPQSIKVKVRRYFRPGDVSEEKSYRSDIREVYYSEQVLSVNLTSIEGKCEVRKKDDLTTMEVPSLYEHVFFCEHLYDPDNGAIKQLPSNVKLGSVKSKDKGKGKEVETDDSVHRKKKGKSKESEVEEESQEQNALPTCQLATLDIFAGCGGLSEGLQRSGVALTKWAIEYEEPAGEAFGLNHPEALTLHEAANVDVLTVGDDEVESCVVVARNCEEVDGPWVDFNGRLVQFWLTIRD